MESRISTVKFTLALLLALTAGAAAASSSQRLPGGAPFNPPRLVSSKRSVEVLVTRRAGLSLRARSSGLMALQFGDSQQSLWEESDFIGLPSSFLQDRFNANPVGLVNRINTLIYHVPADRQSEMVSELRARGYEADAGEVIPVPKPIVEAGFGREVGLKEMAKIIGSDKLQAEIDRVIGSGNSEKNPVIPWALMDTYMKSDSHPYLKGRFIEEVGGAPDGQYHGFHTAGITIGMDRNNFHGKAYNIFPKGTANEGDILLKLELSVTKGNAVTSGNSWGDRLGQVSDRFMPEGKNGSRKATLIEKHALDLGVHYSVSAGNSGQTPNKIGGPANATAQVELVIHGKKIGVIDRIQSIAATDADKKVTSFSSQGPGSPWMAQNNKDGRYNDYPRRPLLAAVGRDVLSTVPPGVGNPVDELGGPGKALSGTSMSQPQAHGAKMQLARAILVLLGDYLPKLESPRATIILALDLAVWTSNKTAQINAADPDPDGWKYGNGFPTVWDAFELSAATLKAAAGKSLSGLGQFGDYGRKYIDRIEFAPDGVRVK